MPVYHFLCDIQHQGKRSGIGFYWGDSLEKHSFLPRVVYKEFILSSARWKITKDDISLLKKTTGKERREALLQWRSALKIPQYVQLVNGDNTLLINLENDNSIDMWLDAVKNANTCILEEFLFAAEGEEQQPNGVVKQGIMGYTNQFVISLFNQGKLNQFKKTKNTLKTAEV